MMAKSFLTHFHWRRPARRNAAGWHCSFCSKDSNDPHKIHSGPEHVTICDECLKIADVIICEDPVLVEKLNQRARRYLRWMRIFFFFKAAPKTTIQFERAPETLACSFCLKAEAEVRKLIAGPAVYICDECVMRFLQSTGPFLSSDSENTNEDRRV